MAVRRSYSDRDSHETPKSRQDDPPNSRLFIVHHKSITEDCFRKAFEKFGTIEEIWMLKDRATGDYKGITYIKFSKCSEAALAYEEMNGQVLEGSPRPLKVMIAHSREQGSKREMNEDERLTRLFIIVPKTTTDVELKEHFKQFGDLDYVSVVKDRETRESKGFAYVKYHRMSHAAKAFEDCDRMYKAVFAQPKKPREVENYSGREGSSSRYDNGRSNGLFETLNYPSYNPIDIHSSIHSSYPESGCRALQVVVPAMVTQDQMWRLFDLVPGLDYCTVKSDPRSRMSRGTVVYHKAAHAAYAREKLHGFEYPPGQRLIVKEDPSVRMEPTSTSPRTPPRALPSTGSTTATPDISNLATLVDTLAQATSIIQAAGLTTPALGSSASRGLADIIPTYCSAKLPPARPDNLAPIESEVKERLFIVCYPKSPPLYALRDVFGRFGNLIDLYILSGKNCGFAQYADKDSAAEAIKALHGQEVLSMRLKVMVAEPNTGEDRRKRIKMDVDN